MTPLTLLDALVVEIKKVAAGIKLPTTLEALQPLSVFAQRLPDRGRDRRNIDNTPYPYCIVRMLTCTDTAPNKAATYTGVLTFGTYDDGSDDGWRDVFNLIEHVRQHLESIRFLGDCFILSDEAPLRMEIPYEQGVNHMEGYLFFSYDVSHRYPEVDFDGREFYEEQEYREGGTKVDGGFR